MTVEHIIVIDIAIIIISNIVSAVNLIKMKKWRYNMLIDILLVYLFAVMKLPTWFLVIVIVDAILRIVYIGTKNS